MYKLKTEASFDSAHFLAGYNGKCSNIHGHRWIIEVEVYKDTLEEEGQTRGMIVDFGTLKKDVRDLAENLDHSLIIEKGSMRELTLNALKEDGYNILEFDFRPTAENFSKYIFDEMKVKGYAVGRATVYETPTNCATYEE